MTAIRKVGSVTLIIVLSIFSLYVALPDLLRIRIPQLRTAPLIKKSNDFMLRFETVSAVKLAPRHLEHEGYADKLAAFERIFVHKYAAWHRRQRRECERNLTYARTLPLLVVRSPRNCGLGDCVRTILQTYLMAVVSRRLFLIHDERKVALWRMWENAPGMNFTFDEHLFLRSWDNDLGVESIRRRGFNAFEQYLGNARVTLQTVISKYWYKPIRHNVAARPYLQIHELLATGGILYFDPDKNEVSAMILKALFRPSQLLREALRGNVPFEGNEYVSLHARLGVGTNEMEARFNTSLYGLSVQESAKCLGHLAAHLAWQQNTSNVYFSTDTRRANWWIAAAVEQALPGGKVEFSSGHAVHLNKLRRRKSEEEALAGLSQIFVDVSLLSGGKSMVFVTSGFADIATWLGVLPYHFRVSLDDCSQLKIKNVTESGVLQMRKSTDRR